MGGFSPNVSPLISKRPYLPRAAGRGQARAVARRPGRSRADSCSPTRASRRLQEVWLFPAKPGEEEMVMGLWDRMFGGGASDEEKAQKRFAELKQKYQAALMVADREGIEFH